jgi:hypothetical protein
VDAEASILVYSAYGFPTVLAEEIIYHAQSEKVNHQRIGAATILRADVWSRQDR